MSIRKILAAVVVTFLLHACSSQEVAQSTTATVESAEPTVEPWVPHELPEDVEFSIISDRINMGNRSVDVRLSKPESALVVRMIAENIKNARSPNCGKAFVTYYLPGMKVGEGAWATAHSSCSERAAPASILGMTAEQYASAVEPREPRAGEVSLGAWLDGRIGSAVRLDLVKRKNQIYLRSEYKDGSSGEVRLVEKEHSLGRKFEERGGNDFGDFYLLTPSGVLQAWDSEGMIHSFSVLR